MKKKILGILALTLMFIVSMATLTACNLGGGEEPTKDEPQQGHTHTYSNEWSYDDAYHWHVATCEHTTEIKDKAEHNFINGVCACGKKEPTPGHTHTYSSDWTYDDTHHWHVATCEHATEIKDKAIHNYVNGVCECGKEEPTPEHTHTYSNEWTYDDTYHWHMATCEHTEETRGKAEHNFVNGVCECGKEEPHTHTYSSDWTYDDTYHWHMATCEHTEETSGKAEHNFVNGVCECGKEEPHTHTYSSDWTYDDTYHWHVATCEHATEIKDKAEHNFINGVCSVCQRKEYSEGLSYTLINDNTEYAVSGIGTCTDTNIVIPSTYNDKPVTTIEEWAFNGCRSLTSVTIGNSVTIIGVRAFQNCSSLQRAIIGNSVTTIEGYAFFCCFSLTNITIGNSVTTIGEYAFSSCPKLQYNEYDNGLYLGNSENKYLVLVKAKNTSITSCVINDNCKIIYGEAFYDCYSLTSVTIPDSVTTIGYDAFRNCSSLTSVTIPDSVTTIGEEAFYNCYKLVEVINLSKLNITKDSFNNGYVGRYALNVKQSGESEIVNKGGYLFYTVDNINYLFAYIGNDTELTLPDSYNEQSYEICRNAFYNNNKITSVTIPNSVTFIGNAAFYKCSSLTNVKIGNGVTTIDNVAFSGCSKLQEITIPFVGNRVGVTSKDTYQYPLGYIFGTDFYTGGVKTEQYYHGYSTSSETSSYYYIPSSLKKVTVLGGYIPFGAFYNCSNIKEIVLGDSVTTIGKHAFSYCSSLQSIEIPNNATTIDIERYAFSDCPKLQYNEYDNGLYLGNSENKYLVFIKAKDRSITSCIISDNCKVLSGGAFEDCSSLTNVTIPNSVTTIGEYAFYKCSSFISVTIPNSVTSIGHSVFYDCSKLQEITIPFVGNRVGVTSKDTYQYPLGYIFGTSSYTGGVKTEQYYYGSSMSDLTNNYYYIPSSLKKVTVLGGYMPYGAFYNCSNIQEIVLGDSVTIRVREAFYNCSSLEYNEYDNGLYLGNSENKYLVLVKAKDKSITSCVINDNCKFILEYAFYNYSSLTSVTIGNSVTTIGKGVFEDCSSLTSVTIGNSVTTIDEYEFRGCSKLQSITIDEKNSNYKSIDGNLYSKDGKTLIQYAIGKKDTTFEIPDSVTTIGDRAFYSCSSLTSVTIPDSVTTIGSSAFYKCSSLTTITIPNSVTTIYSGAFSGCSSLTTITIPNSVTTIYTGAFRSCSSLQSVTIPDSVTTIGWEAFRGCSSLKSVTIPDSVTTIEDYAFCDCSSLTSVTIGNSVTTIGERAFIYCYKLQNITFNDSFSWYRTTSSTNWQNKIHGTYTDLSNPTQNATYFMSTYYNYYWYKK